MDRPMESNSAQSEKALEEVVRNDHSYTSSHLLKAFKSAQGDVTEQQNTAINDPLVVKAITKLKKKKNLKDVSTKDLEALNKRFMSGHLPRHKPCYDDADDESDDEESSHMTKKAESASFFSKLFDFQLRVLQQVKDYVLKHVSRHGNTWLRSMIPTNQIVTLITFLLYSYLLNSEFLLYFMPLLIFAVSFLALVVSTLQSLRGEKRFQEFVAWSRLLRSVKTMLNLNEAEDNYFKNHISPLISFPLALILNVMSFASSTKEVLPMSEMGLVSFGLCLATFFSYYSNYTRQSFIALATQVLATVLEGFSRLSAESHSTERLSIFLGTWNDAQFNLNLPVILRCVSLAFAFSLPFQVKYRSVFVGILRGLVPFLYVSLWWELFCLFFLHSSVSGIFRASVASLAILFSIPSALLLFVATFFNWLLSLQFLKAVITLLALLLPVFYVKFSHLGYEKLRQVDLSLIGPSLKIVFAVSLVSLGLSVVIFYRPSGLQVLNSSLTWDDYVKFCRTGNDDGSDFQTRLCHQLNGHHVNWTGVVQKVQITTIDNTFESIVNVLPSGLANWLTCIYGEKYPLEDQECVERKQHFCSLANKSGRACHLDRYNRYDFTIVVQHDIGDALGSIQLMASNKFKEKVFLLHRGMKIRYRGVLQSNSGVVKLQRLLILDEKAKQVHGSVDLTLTSVLDHSAKALVRFLFSPFITISHEEDDT